MSAVIHSPELGTILSVWAHPDDETYLAAGVMAAAVDRGQRVVCVSATAGEHGTSDPDTWPPLRLGRRRTWEAAAAMAVLGVADHRILGFPDGGLVDHDEEGLAAVGGLLDEVRPDTILTFGPDGITFHPDHVAVSRWVTTAWEQRGRPCRLLYATYTAEHLARFGATYEELGIYMTDERPTGATHRATRRPPPPRGLAARSQAHRPRGDGVPDQRGDRHDRPVDVRRQHRRRGVRRRDRPRRGRRSHHDACGAS